MRSIIPTLATVTSLLAPAVAAADAERLWPLLAQVRFEERGTEDDWTVSKTFPAELRALSGPVTLRGYPVTVLPEAEVTNFLLVQDPEDCPYCGSNAGYGPTLEVRLAAPLPFLEEGRAQDVTGTLELIEAPDTYQAFRLTGARFVGP